MTPAFDGQSRVSRPEAQGNGHKLEIMGLTGAGERAWYGMETCRSCVTRIIPWFSF